MPAGLRRRLAIALLLLGSSACAPTSPSGLTDALLGSWQATSVQRQGAAAASLPDPARFTVQFSSGGSLQLKADCNTCVGTYQATAGGLKVGQAMACTQAFCPSSPLDTTFASLVGAATSWSVATDGTLTLDSAAGSVRLRR